MHSSVLVTSARILWLLLIFSVIGALIARGEDWKTVDGKVYQEVKVIKVEPDAVTILDKEGGALVPIATLPADLQKRFNYDPEKGKLASAARAAAEAREAKINAAQLEIQAQQEREALKQKELRDAVAKNEEGLYGKVFEVVKFPGHLKGYLVNTFTRFDVNEPQWDGPIILAIDQDRDYVDGDIIGGKVFYCGTWQYTTTMGSTATVRVCTRDVDTALRVNSILNKQQQASQ